MTLTLTPDHDSDWSLTSQSALNCESKSWIVPGARETIKLSTFPEVSRIVLIFDAIFPTLSWDYKIGWKWGQEVTSVTHLCKLRHENRKSQKLKICVSRACGDFELCHRMRVRTISKYFSRFIPEVKNLLYNTGLGIYGRLADSTLMEQFTISRSDSAHGPVYS